MTRFLCLAALLAVVGCLSPGQSPYGALDEQPPAIVSIDPPIGPQLPPPAIDAGQVISITFTEQLSVDSLRPGIAIRDRDLVERPLSLHLVDEPAPVSYAVDMDGVPTNIPMTVQVTSAGDPFPRGTYQLILRTLLIDRAGNPLEAETAGILFFSN